MTILMAANVHQSPTSAQVAQELPGIARTKKLWS